MDRRSLLRFTTLAPFGVLGTLSSARGQQHWPQRTVKLIVPLGPGSGADIASRLVADRLSRTWGEPVIVENRPGGDGLVGISAFVGAHDDHVLFVGANTTFAPHPFVHKKLPYDAKRDVIPIAGFSELSIGIAAPTSLNVNALTELVTLARSEPGKLNWGAITAIDDFMFGDFLHGAGLSMSRVPYRDPVSALNDLSEGRIDICLSALALSLPRFHTGKVNVLAVTNPRRSKIAPEVPTVSEAGYSSLTYDPILGLFGPNTMTPDIRHRIANGLQGIAADSGFAARLIPTGQVAVFMPTGQFEEAIDAERLKVAEIARRLGIKPTQ